MPSSIVDLAQRGEQIRFGSNHQLRTVLPVCPDGGRWRGDWYCEPHQEVFGDDAQKDLHVQQRGKHRLVWWCSGHGPEAPI